MWKNGENFKIFVFIVETKEENSLKIDDDDFTFLFLVNFF